MGKELSEMSLEELWELFPIILKEHNPSYKDWYLIEKTNLLNSIGENIQRINHIGSSYIDGLISKPTVDILLEVNRDCNIERLKTSIEEAGFGLMSEEYNPDMKLSFNKGYTKDGFAKKVYHLHVRFLGDWDELYFRDYLMEHEDVSAEYGKLKLSLLDEFRNNRDGYTMAKTEFVKKYTKLARHEFEDRYKPQK